MNGLNLLVGMKLSLLTLMVMNVAWMGALSGYHGVGGVEVNDVEWCEEPEYEPPQDELAQKLIKMQEPPDSRYEDCDPNDPIYDQLDVLMNFLQYQVYEPWYEVGEVWRQETQP